MEKLRILLVEDSELDAELTRATLHEGGIAHDVVRVQLADDFAKAVKDPTLDLIISDYILPKFSGMSALKLANEIRPDLPFIFLSGALGEELAIESLKTGATDYVLKQRMVRLAPAVQRAVAEFRERRDLKLAEAQLREEQRITGALHRIGMRLAAERDVQKLVQMVTDEATALSGAQFGAFFYNVVNSSGEAYMLYTISGVPREAFEKFPMPRNTEVFAHTFSGTGPVCVDDVTKDPRYGKNEPYFGLPKGHLPVRSYLAVPVISRDGEVLGGLFFGHSDVGVFQERDERLTSGMASQAAVAIDNARLYQQLRAGEEQYRFLAESIPQMVWTTTAEGALDYCNRRWCDYTGMSVQHSLGAGWLSTVHQDDLPGVMEGWRTAVSGGDFEKEYRIRASDGEFRWHLSRAIPMRDGQGRTVRFFGTSTDIHDRRQNEQAIREAKESAEAASRAKDQFLAVLSHELRTPLMPVLTTVQTLKIDPDLPRHIRSDLEMIRRNVELEARLIDDLLDLTRIAKGKLQLNLESVDVHTSIASALEICRGDIASKRINVVTALRATRTIVLGDPARLQQVFWNLVNNAIKFTPAGGTLTFRSEDAADHRVSFSVTDTGIGIDADVLPRIFDAFEQGQTTVTRKFGGLGLGLAISRALVGLHGGTITANSDGKDRGTTFSIELPLMREALRSSRSPSREDSGDVGAASSGPPAPDINILLVDDHEDTNRAMCRLLERLGYKVRTAQSVRTALEAAEQAPFDLLISDIGLPDGSGVDLMRQLMDRHKSSGASQPLRGIALSGFGMEEDIQRSRDAGFHDHLIKPVNFKRLETVIRELTSEMDKA